MLPVGFCEKSDSSGRGWTRVGSDVAYFKNCRTYPRRKTSTTTDNRTSLDAAPYRKHDRHHYTLTFLVALPHPLDGGDDTGSETDSDVVLLSRSPKTRSPQLRKRRRKKDDRLFLAHCFPYTYSDLRNELVALDDCPGPAVVRRRRARDSRPRLLTHSSNPNKCRESSALEITGRPSSFVVSVVAATASSDF